MPKKNILEEQNKFNRIDDKTKKWLEGWAKPRYTIGSNLYSTLEKVRGEKPKVVFLTQTSSIPYGVAFKEAWRNAYPNDSIPKFLTIDVKTTRAYRQLRDLKQRLYEDFYKKPAPTISGWKDEKIVDIEEINKSMREDERFGDFYDNQIEKRAKRSATNVMRGVKEKLRRYGVRSGDNVVVLDDQTPEGGPSVDKLKYSYMGTIGIAKKVVEEAAKEVGDNIHVDHTYISSARLPQRGLGPWIGGSQTGEYSSYKHKLMPTRRYSGFEERNISQSNMTYLKGLGREAGKKIRERRNLEGKLVSLVGVVSFILASLFLTSNFTGNVIANLSVKTSSFIGAALFIVVLFALFIYFKRKY